VGGHALALGYHQIDLGIYLLYADVFGDGFGEVVVLEPQRLEQFPDILIGLSAARGVLMVGEVLFIIFVNPLT